MPQLLNMIAGLNWLEIVKATAPVATAVIAFTALRSWQSQDKARREAEFLDALVEAAHVYIAELPSPISVVEMAKISMESHAPNWEDGDESEIAVRGAIAFIQKDGERVGGRLLEKLTAIRGSVVKLRALNIKGQIFHFSNYQECQDSVAMLAWQFDRMESFAAYISTSSWNWKNTIVQEGLRQIMSIDASDIRLEVQKNHASLIGFSRVAYRRIYG